MLTVRAAGSGHKEPSATTRPCGFACLDFTGRMIVAECPKPTFCPRGSTSNRLSAYYFRYASCAIAPVGRCCSILLWHLLLSVPRSRLDPVRDALSLAGHLAAGLPGKPETGVTPLQPRAHRGSTGRSRRIVICAAPNIRARLRAHLVVPYRL